jgi:hypothetical protein
VNRIQVNGRRFGYKVGSMILAFKEYGEREKKNCPSRFPALTPLIENKSAP